MKRLYIILAVVIVFIANWWVGALPVKMSIETKPNMAIINLSEKLLYAVKTEAKTDSLEASLAGLKTEQLIEGLPNDTARKTFWINIYNAYFQLLSSREKIANQKIFSEKSIKVAEQMFSLDDIEHGILRKYRSKYGMGYLPQFLPSTLIKKLAVSNIDYRIHFALNCGAKSCPPISFYSYDKLDKQLDMATVSFLKSETDIDTTKKVLHVSRIMQWYTGDFGGKTGTLSILSNLYHQDFTDYKIIFKDYDWSAHLKNYSAQ